MISQILAGLLALSLLGTLFFKVQSGKLEEEIDRLNREMAVYEHTIASQSQRITEQNQSIENAERASLAAQALVSRIRLESEREVGRVWAEADALIEQARQGDQSCEAVEAFIDQQLGL